MEWDGICSMTESFFGKLLEIQKTTLYLQCIIKLIHKNKLIETYAD